MYILLLPRLCLPCGFLVSFSCALEEFLGIGKAIYDKVLEKFSLKDCYCNRVLQFLRLVLYG
jgi:hypothetical protein